MPSAPLYATVTVKANGSGVASAKVGPLSAREKWHPGNVAVTQAGGTPVNEAQCAVSVGDSNTKQFRDRTFTGSSGDSTDKCNNDTVGAGAFIWADWTGGDANVYFTLTVTGTKDI